MDTFATTLGGEPALLSASGAVVLPERRTLLVADLHVGKVQHFRNAGAPLPLEAEWDTLHKLSKELEVHRVEQVFVIGDLFHSRANAMNKVWDDFMEHHPTVAFSLVPGNHDAAQGRFSNHLQVTEVTHHLGSITLVHDPAHRSGTDFSVSGHLHPGIRLHGKGRMRATLPCFWWGQEFLVLPAFGRFTGCKAIKPLKNHHVVALHGGTLLHIA